MNVVRNAVVLAVVLASCRDAARSTPATTSSAPAPSAGEREGERERNASSTVVSAVPPPSSAPVASVEVPNVVVPAASSFANELPRFLESSPKCAVPRGMPTWSWDTLMRVEGLDVDAVVLTLDAGARVANLEKELDILRDRQVHATVFLYTGEVSKSKTGPDVVKRILAEGHELGNHTLTHRDLTKLSEGDVAAEVDAVESFVHDATGATTRPYFRAPFLATNASVEGVLRARCFRSIWITVDTKDDRKDSKAADIVRAVLEDKGNPRVFKRGSILLFHGSQPENLVALPKVIDGIRARGFAILTLSDALRLAKPQSPVRPLAK